MPFSHSILLFTAFGLFISCLNLVEARSPSPRSPVCDKRSFGPNCGGNLAAVVRANDDITNCTLVHLNNQNGYAFNVSLLSVCLDRDTSFTKIGLPRTTFYTPDRKLFFTTGTGAFVHNINNDVGTSFKFASIPNDISYIVGLFTVDTTFYLLTIDSLFSAPIDDSTSVRPLTLVSTIDTLSQDALVAAAGSSGIVYILDGSVLTTITLPTETSAIIAEKTTVNGLAHPLDLQYRHSDSLIILDSYKLLELPLNANVSDVNFVVSIPNGPGFPAVNDLFLDIFFFADFKSVYNIDLLNNNTISSPSPFNGYFCQGNFHYFF